MENNIPHYELTENEFSFDIDYYPDGIFSKQTILSSSIDEDDGQIVLTHQRAHLKQIVNAINSAPSLQSEIDRLTSENNDLTCKMEDMESEFNVEIDRLKEERQELVKIIQDCKPAVLHCYEQSSRNGAHQEFLSEDRDLMRRMEEATRIK